MPTNTTVVLKITSSDVIHSWWIPKLGGKADAVPGHTNETWFKISKAGTYEGQCAELCGDNHADMRAVVRGRAARRSTRPSSSAQKADIKAAQDGLADAAPSQREGGRGREPMEAGAIKPARES